MFIFRLGELLLLSSLFNSILFAHEVDYKGKALDKISFGSCNLQLSSQKHWDVILKDAPEVWIWGGDIIYADRLSPYRRNNEFNRLKFNPHYKKFRKDVRILGTWDDHDFGSNNVDGTYVYKKEVQKLILDFLDEPLNSSRRTQEGIYSAAYFGPKEKRVQVIVLDLRYFKSVANKELLGEVQWQWFEDQLLGREARVRIVMLSTQLLPDEHNHEHIGQFPEERRRFLKLFERVQGKLLILSGDRHLAEITRYPLGSEDNPELFEFTSSGLTHHAPSWTASPNSLRVGPLFTEKNYGNITFNWKGSSPSLGLEIKSINGKTIYQQRVK